jgi:hypothetical protein
MDRITREAKEVIAMERTGQFIFAVMAAVLTTGLLAPGCDQADARAGREMKELIESLEVGDPVYYENLTIIPVYSRHIRDYTDYATLDEALAKGWLEVTEVEAGRVPQVKVTNHSHNPVFIMGGEILTGCRQDRLVGRDALLRPRARNVIVPVYCVEKGRWNYESPTFQSRKNLGTPVLRAEGQKASPGAQAEIWDRVSVTCDRVGMAGGSERFQKAYESEEVRRETAAIEKRLEIVPRLCPDAIGVVIGVADGISSVDIFANPGVFRNLWPKLLKSSALAAVCRDGGGGVDQSEAVSFLRRLHGKRLLMRPAIDLGFELSVVDREVNVNALVYRDAIIHLAAFPEGEQAWKNESTQDNQRRIRVMRR